MWLMWFPLLSHVASSLWNFIGFAWIWLEKSNGSHFISIGSEWIWLVNPIRFLWCAHWNWMDPMGEPNDFLKTKQFLDIASPNSSHFSKIFLIIGLIQWNDPWSLSRHQHRGMLVSNLYRALIQAHSPWWLRLWVSAHQQSLVSEKGTNPRTNPIPDAPLPRRIPQPQKFL